MVEKRTYPVKPEAVTNAMMVVIERELDKQDRKFPGLDLSSLTNSVLMVMEKRCRDIGLAPAFHRFQKGNRLFISGVIQSTATPSGRVRRSGNRMVVGGIVHTLIESYEAHDANEVDW